MGFKLITLYIETKGQTRAVSKSGVAAHVKPDNSDTPCPLKPFDDVSRATQYTRRAIAGKTVHNVFMDSGIGTVTRCTVDVNTGTSEISLKFDPQRLLFTENKEASPEPITPEIAAQLHDIGKLTDDQHRRFRRLGDLLPSLRRTKKFLRAMDTLWDTRLPVQVETSGAQSRMRAVSFSFCFQELYITTCHFSFSIL